MHNSKLQLIPLPVQQKTSSFSSKQIFWFSHHFVVLAVVVQRQIKWPVSRGHAWPCRDTFPFPIPYPSHKCTLVLAPRVSIVKICLTVQYMYIVLLFDGRETKKEKGKKKEKRKEKTKKKIYR